MLFDSFQKGTPGPQLPGDRSFLERQRGAVSDIGGVARSVMDYLKQFREVQIDTADGQRMTVLAKFPRGAAGVYRPFWHCRVESAGVVNVARGIVEWHTRRGASGNAVELIKRTWAVAEAEVTGLVDTDVIYCTVEHVATTGGVKLAHFIDDDGDEGNAEWQEAGFTTTGLCAIEKLAAIPTTSFGFRDQYLVGDGSDIAASTSDLSAMPPTAEVTGKSYYPLAIYHETDGVGSIEQLRLGAPIFGHIFTAYHSTEP